MAKDFSNLSNDELFAMAGRVPLATQDVSQLSDDELFAMAGQQPTQQPAFLDKALQFTQKLATGQPLKAAGEVATNIPVGLGKTAVGATQALR